MAVPKQKTSRARQGARRSHLKIKPTPLTLCTHCQQPTVAYRVCKNCGYYKGKKVIEIKSKITTTKNKK